jgi:hypothetical protein
MTTKQRALRAIQVLVTRQPMITSDDVHAHVGSTNGDDPRALGGAFLAAQEHGLIVKSDMFVESQRAVCHQRPVRVWYAAKHNWRAVIRQTVTEALAL